MSRLSSCYFCGGSLDVSLAEYPIVPKALQSADDEGSTVVLCSTCRQKLGAVVEEVVAAAETDTTPEAAIARDQSAETTATNAVEPTGGSLLDDTAHGDPAANGAATPGAGEPDSPGSDSPVDDSATDEPAPTPHDEKTGPTTEPTGASDDEMTDDAEPKLTKLEYNKVMRLLQNRSFPVDRGEIREIATSAYEIDSQEFDAVIDAAVERDLIAVENGQFVDSE